MRLKFLNTLFSLRSPFRILYHQFRARCACFLYGNPSRGMHIIGVTGTKGKSSTVNYIGDILHQYGLKVAVFSTVKMRICDTVYSNTLKMTSPDPFDLQKFLRQAKNAGCTTLVLEVSSHALFYDRIHGIDFDIVALTNISQDHLDLHGSMDDYIATKLKLFSRLMEYERKEGIKKISIVNLGSQASDLFLAQTADIQSPYGVVPGAQIRADSIVSTAEGLSFMLRFASHDIRISTQLIGSFHVENILCATAVLIAMKLPIDFIETSLQSLRPLSGRMEPISNTAGLQIFLDYAHTEASLAAVLDSAKNLHPQGSIILIFGATGMRDVTKRPKMGKVAHEKADIIVLTQDDDYEEDGYRIIRDVSMGIPRKEGNGFWIIKNRREAIKTALILAKPGDILIFAGKGAEEVLVTNDGPIPWNEGKIIQDTLADIARQELISR